MSHSKPVVRLPFGQPSYEIIVNGPPVPWTVVPTVMIKAAYAPDSSFGVVRETDLEHHLPAEGSTERPANKGKQTDEQGEDDPATSSSKTHLGVAREIPDDPTNGPDFQLSVAYQIVTGVMGLKDQR